MNERNKLARRVRSKLENLQPGTHRISVSLLGNRIELKLRIVPQARKLIAHFHGAINRETRRPPVFNGFLDGADDAHQVSLADPSLFIDKPFSISWFAGHEAFDTQSIYTQLFRILVSELAVERTIYFGSSGGGYAALYFSHCHPGSIAVAGNPQVRLLSYSQKLLRQYREACWPALQTNEELQGATCADLLPLYAGGYRNTVIYIQSMGDRVHSAKHMLPFAGAISQAPGKDRFLLHSDYPGEMGHRRTSELYRQWVRAACAAPSIEPADLLDSFHAIRQTGKTTPESAMRPKASSRTEAKGEAQFTAKDLHTADMLRYWRRGGA